MHDVQRLNSEMLHVGLKYSNLLSDKPKTRYAMQLCTLNLLLQEALNDACEQTFNV